MSTEPRSPSEHYQAAERLLAAAESSITEEIQTSAALIALVHAVLTLAPRKARRHDGDDGMTPRQWLAEPKDDQ
jgi:hypothetical protein